ncbi:MAG: HD domain-containing protein [Pirellulaceae bacterium]|jgi:3'-5' exoribonuclease|nr:HD domain-containing protein [Pirellulaceae bacterium]
MPRRYINQLGEHESVDQVFLVSDKQLRTNRNGNLYLQLRLSDRSGSLTAMLWNASDQVYGSFDTGEYVRVQATTQFYNGALQMIAQRLERVDATTVDESEFQTLASTDIDQLATRLAETLRSIRNFHLRCLAECFLIDEPFMEKFLRAPAGIKNHHAYHGGLVEHVNSLMAVCRAVAPLYPNLDGDLLLLGAFLHDVGKVHELTYDRELGYSDEGQLIGHLVIAVEMLEQKIAECQSLSNEPFPAQLKLLLKHMILSHHGEYEFGSPKLPMTPEAVALHYLDNLDAKLQLFGTLIEGDANTESNWTPFQPTLGRKLFKGAATDRTAEEP